MSNDGERGGEGKGADLLASMGAVSVAGVSGKHSSEEIFKDLFIVQSELIDISRKLNNSDSIDETLGIMAEVIDDNADVDGFSINIADVKQKNLVCEFVSLPKEYKGFESTLRYYRYSLDYDGLNARAFKTKQSVFINEDEIVKYSERMQQRYFDWKMMSQVIIPICDGDSAIGTVMISRKNGELTSETVSLLKEKLSFFCKMIQKQRYYADLERKEQQIKRSVEEMEDFHLFIGRISELTSAEQIYETIAEQFLKNYDFNMCGIYLRTSRGLEVKKISTSDDSCRQEADKWFDYWSKNVYRIDMAEGAPAVAFIKNIYVYLEDIQQVAGLPMSVKDKGSYSVINDIHSCLHMPITYRGEAIGILSLWGVRKKVVLDDKDVQFIRRICAFAGTAIRNAETYSVVEKQKKEIEKAAADLERAKVDAESSANAKSFFLANMSHEIRTPLNAIVGLSGLMQHTALSVKQSDYIKKIDGASKHLLGVINDILDFSKIDAGKLSIENIEFNLKERLGEICAFFADKIPEKGIDIVFNYPPFLPAVVMGDQLRIGQVVTNLLGNSIKFTKSGYVELKIEVDNNEKLVISVTDTGIGIPSEKTNALFESYTQAEDSTSRNYGGTGLGLAISKKLVEAMGGEISVSSRVGEGSCFSFTLPFVEGLLEEEGSKENIKRTLYGKSAVIYDDCQALRRSLAKMLSYYGVECVSIGSQYELEHILEQSKHIDIAIVDYAAQDEDSKYLHQLKDLKNNGASVIALMSISENFKNQDAPYTTVINKPVLEEVLIAGIVGEELYKNRCADETFLAKRPVSYDGKRALLVEDNAINQQVALELLKNIGFGVEIAETGLEAIKMLELRYYDIVFMDIKMPVMGGIEATEKIRLNPAFKKLPIIAMTANAMSGDEKVCIDAGMNAYISKPIDPQVLYATINKQLTSVVTKEDMEECSHNDISGCRILLVDDNELNRLVAVDLLEEHSVDMITAESGNEAISILKKERIDIVLMDIQMPELDGYQACKMIREDIQIDDIPIVAVTADNSRGDREKRIDAGMDGYVLKPFSSEELVAVISLKLMRKSRR
ncbi:MAG: response regulator [Gammaproteobacteria bacterium]|nr:MAG: response regulator [Gammaproteobacteria bacterium]